MDFAGLNAQRLEKLKSLQPGRHYTIAASAHGSGLFFGPLGIPEPHDWLTLEEANTQEIDWELRADTVGGRAVVVDLIALLESSLTPKVEQIVAPDSPYVIPLDYSRIGSRKSRFAEAWDTHCQ